MRGQAMTLEEFYSPNVWLPLGAALGFHVFLLLLNPTVLRAGPYSLPNQPMMVTSIDHLPVMEPVKPVVKPVEKKHAVKKAKKSGLALTSKAHPVHPRPRTAPKAYSSKITIPKFVPTETDEPIAASPLPGAAPAARERMTRASVSPPRLSGKTRGVRAGDVHFQLSDRGSLAADAGPVIAIPIGEERGETVALPNAAVMHEAPLGQKTISGYRFKPGEGSGSGELSGRDKGGMTGYHGVAKADSYIEGSLQGAQGKVVAGKGFEIGGPVGDRKIIARKLPEYPTWAEEKGISAMVKVYFTVRPDGSIRPNFRIVNSSGYSELDDLAKQALLQWRFSQASEDSAETAWGIITFRFTLD